jgi:TPR repeat protein
VKFGDFNSIQKPSLGETRSAAEKGNARAQYLLGLRYEEGLEVSQDDAEAANWYRKSADGGDANAQLALALMYEWGRSLVPDDVQADTWYTIAISTFADQGSQMIAQRCVGIRDNLEQRMTPEQIAEARKRAQNRKPTI